MTKDKRISHGNQAFGEALAAELKQKEEARRAAQEAEEETAFELQMHEKIREINQAAQEEKNWNLCLIICIVALLILMAL